MANPIFGHSIDGGFDTEMGPSAGFSLKGDGSTVSVPWLIRAQNCVYARDGWPKKMPGASKVNATPTGASDAVMGIFDYWRSTTSGSPVQRRVIVSGTQIYQESSGTLSSIKTPIVAGEMWSFEVMNDVLYMASTSDTDVPYSWNQTTFANMLGTPPNFAFIAEHKTRMWGAGVLANKSRLYYSAASNPGDWVGTGSGSIDITPDDGDQITGIVSHKNELIIFKGPNRGRILRLVGSSPSDFALIPFVRGVGCTSHQSIVSLSDDLLFWDEDGIHSLNATAAYGDYSAAFISAPIRSYFLDGLNHNRMVYVSGVNVVNSGYAIWTATTAGATTNDVIIMYDYRFSPPRFAVWTAYAAASLGSVRDTSRRATPWSGTYTGTVLRMNQATQDIGGTAYAYDVLWPYISYGDPFLDKVVRTGRIGYAPRGETVITVGYQRDGQAQQTAMVNDDLIATLGPSNNEFILDTDVLGGGRYLNQFFDMAGQFKELQINLTQSATVTNDAEPHSLALEIEAAGIGTTGNLG